MSVYQFVKERINIIEVIGSDERLENRDGDYSGSHKVKHESKSGACLKVSEKKQVWYCHHCRTGGDVFNYVADRDRLTPFKALEKLAAAHNIELPMTPEERERRRLEEDERRELRVIMKDCFAFYHERARMTGKVSYFHERGITDETINRLLLGYAPNRNALFQHMCTKHSVENLLATGLFKRENGEINDLYRDRFVFPYWLRDETVFSIGRKPKNDTNEQRPKYIKHLTPERYAYVSAIAVTHVIYNEVAALTADEVLITEGIVDAILAIQLGYDVLSPATTRFGERDASRIIKLTKHVENIYIANDNEGNREGEKGALKTAKQLFEAGRNVRICTIRRPPEVDKVDLADFIVTSGETAREAVDELLKTSETLISFLINRIDTDDDDGFPDVVEEIIKLIARRPKLEQERYFKALKVRTGFNLGTMRGVLKGLNESNDAGGWAYMLSQDYISLVNGFGWKSIRLLELDDSIEVNGATLNDADYAAMSARVRDYAIRNELGFIKDHFRELLVLEAKEHGFNPIREYLEGGAYDGKDYITELCAYIKDHDGVFKRWLTTWLVGAIAKIYGYHQNPMLVFDGTQGLGKSYFAKWLLRDLERLFYAGTIVPDSKDCLIRLTNTWIWEVEELGATTRRQDIEAIKAFISKSDVRVRKPYGQLDTTKKSITSFIGTVNADGGGFLVDKTGNRRFLTCTLSTVDWNYAERINPSAIWAQAHHIYQTSQNWRLTAEDAAQRDAINAEHETPEPVEDFLRDFVVFTGIREHFISSSELFNLVTNEIRTGRSDKSVAMSIAAAMKRIGAEKCRVGNMQGFRQVQMKPPIVWGSHVNELSECKGMHLVNPVTEKHTW